MMRGRDKARLKHLALAAKEPFTMSCMMAKWTEIFGCVASPPRLSCPTGSRS